MYDGGEAVLVLARAFFMDAMSTEVCLYMGPASCTYRVHVVLSTFLHADCVLLGSHDSGSGRGLWRGKVWFLLPICIPDRFSLPGW